MENIRVLIAVGIIALIFMGKSVAPKIVGRGKEGANAWSKALFGKDKNEEVVDGASEK